MNVLLVTVDSLRADRLQAETMPRTRSFADDSVEYTDCVANGSSTPASFPSIHASRHFGSISGLGLPENGGVVTLAEQLRDAGYATAGFTDNHFASDSYRFGRGFEHLYDAGDTVEAGRWKQTLHRALDKRFDKDGLVFRTTERLYTAVDGLFSAAGGGTEYERARSLNQRALSWIENNDEPWFVWLHYMDPHHPYEPPPEYQRDLLGESLSPARCRQLARKATHHPAEMSVREWSRLETLYDAECRYVDDAFADLVAELGDRREETLTVFTADHGELFGEHGHGGHPGEFWEGVIRVPFVVDGLGQCETVDEQARLLDLPPTVTDAVDVDPAAEWTGQSLLPLVDGGDPPMFAFGEVGRAIDYEKGYIRRADGWKLLDHADDGTFLFDIRENPAEQPDADQYDSEPAIRQTLERALDDHRERIRDLRSGVRGVSEDTEMVTDHLEDLGYM